MSESVILAIAAPIAAAIGGAITLYVQARLKRKEPPTVPPDEFLRELQKLSDIHAEVLDLMCETSVDRFLILRAENGVDEPKYATVIYEQHKGRPYIIATAAYVHISTDEEYRRMLKTAEATGICRMSTASMPDCILKRVYQHEKVEYSNCFFLGRTDLGNGRAVVCYMTCATHAAQAFDPLNDELPQLLLVDRLRNLLYPPVT